MAHKNPLVQQEIVLTLGNVQLEPLSSVHLNGIYRAAQDGDVFKHMSSIQIKTPDDARRWMDAALSAKEKGMDYPFVSIDRKSGEIVGSTRFLGIDDTHRKLEIGSTWLSQRMWGTHFNTGCKYLLLTYVFETLYYYRVQFVTDEMNTRSQKAIEKIGATREGLLRNAVIRRDGTHRNSVIYSIIFQEWPGVKQRLERLLSDI